MDKVARIPPKRAWGLPDDSLLIIAECLTSREKYAVLNRVCKEFHRVFQEEDRLLAPKRYGDALIHAVGGLDHLLRIPLLGDDGFIPVSMIHELMVEKGLSLARSHLRYTFQTAEGERKEALTGVVFAMIRDLTDMTPSTIKCLAWGQTNVSQLDHCTVGRRCGKTLRSSISIKFHVISQVHYAYLSRLIKGENCGRFPLAEGDVEGSRTMLTGGWFGYCQRQKSTVSLCLGKRT